MPKIENTFDALSFRYFLLDNYKKLKITEQELCVLLMCDHLIKQGNKLITADVLRLKMNLHTKEIDSILVSLMNKKFIEYVTDEEGMTTSLEPLRKKLYHIFELDIASDKTSFQSKEREQIIGDLQGFFEKNLGRSLSPIERDLLCSWLDDDFTIEEIKDALLITIRKGKKTFRAIDLTLKNIRSKDDIQKEGYSAVSKDNWSKDIEETLKIAKTKWLDNDK